MAISASGNEILVGDPEGGENGTGAVTEFTLSGGTWSAGTALSTPANHLHLRHDGGPFGQRQRGPGGRPWSPRRWVGDPLHPQ